MELVLTLCSLELGAGGGLVGLGVALGCPCDNTIYITDQENMISLMEQNVLLNRLESRVVPLVLNWYVRFLEQGIKTLTKDAGVICYRRKSSSISQTSYWQLIVSILSLRSLFCLPLCKNSLSFVEMLSFTSASRRGGEQTFSL